MLGESTSVGAAKCEVVGGGISVGELEALLWGLFSGGFGRRSGVLSPRGGL